jgi:hypothetical protein
MRVAPAARTKVCRRAIGPYSGAFGQSKCIGRVYKHLSQKLNSLRVAFQNLYWSPARKVSVRAGEKKRQIPSRAVCRENLDCGCYRRNRDSVLKLKSREPGFPFKTDGEDLAFRYPMAEGFLAVLPLCWRHGGKLWFH